MLNVCFLKNHIVQIVILFCEFVGFYTFLKLILGYLRIEMDMHLYRLVLSLNFKAFLFLAHYLIVE